MSTARTPHTTNTLTVTQAGSSYVNPAARNLVPSGLTEARGVAVDSDGSVYFIVNGHSPQSFVNKWNVSTQKVTTLVSGLSFAKALAVDFRGDVYIADLGNGAIKKWTASTGQVTTLVSSGLDRPEGVAVDPAGNVFIADTNNNVIKKWDASNGQVSIVVNSGLNAPDGLATDAAGNVYIADGYHAIKKLDVSIGQVTPLTSTDSNPEAVAVDGAGNVYYVDNFVIKKWTAATGQVSNLVTGLYDPEGVAADQYGNVYYSDQSQIKARYKAYVPAGAFKEGWQAGGDSTLPILLSPLGFDNDPPPLTGFFGPRSNQSWLRFADDRPNNRIFFYFTPNYGQTRTAYITVLGQKITVTQVGLVAPVTNRIPVGMFPGMPNPLQNLTRVLGGWNA